MAQKKNDQKKELARILFMHGENQQQIADRVGVSRITVGRWIEGEGWKKLRSAKAITRPELINKMLQSMNTVLEKASEEGVDIGALSDKLSKIAAAIEKLDKGTSVVDVVEVFITFNKWLQGRSAQDKEITQELLATINRLQDLFIHSHMAGEGQQV